MDQARMPQSKGQGRGRKHRRHETKNEFARRSRPYFKTRRARLLLHRDPADRNRHGSFDKPSRQPAVGRDLPSGHYRSRHCRDPHGDAAPTRHRRKRSGALHGLAIVTQVIDGVRMHRERFGRAFPNGSNLSHGPILSAHPGAVKYFATQRKTLCYHGRLPMQAPMQALFESLPAGHADEALARALNPERLPRHIAIIMDGNGRWARRRGQLRVAGHKAGMRPVRTVIETCSQMGIQALTLYAFSIENWKRPRTEVEMLWRLLRTYLRLELPEMMRQQIRMNAIGRLDALPPQVHSELLEVLAETSANRGLQVNLAINYGARAELVDAVKALVEKASRGEVTAESIDEAAISANLYTAGIPDPDLLIRTSGEMRVSNFLLWQIAYAELYVTETLWPDFTRADLLRAILDYQRRDRRFGGLGGPVPAGLEPRYREALGAPVR